MNRSVVGLKLTLLLTLLSAAFIADPAGARDSVWVWYGNAELSPIDATIGDTLQIDVFMQTGDSAYVADMMLVLGYDEQYFDTLISEVAGAVYFPLTEWDLAYFYSPEGSPPNPDGWLSQAFQGYAELAPPYESPYLHVGVPYKILTMAGMIVNNPGIGGQTVAAIGPGLNSFQGPSNAGDPAGGQGYEVIEYFSAVHFIGETGFLQGNVENPDGTPLEDVSISISPSDTTVFTDQFGDYFIELIAGNYQLLFSRPGYQDTAASVTVTVGSTATLDMQMTPLPSGFVTGIISDTSEILLANIFVHDTQQTDGDTSSTDGIYLLELPQGSYVIEFSGLGFRDTSVADIIVTVNETTYVDMVMTVDESEIDQLPETIIIRQNYPNPFNTGTIIEFVLEKPMRVDVEIFDILGRKVETVASRVASAGSNFVTWYPGDIASGIYFCRIRSANNDESRAMLYIK